MKLPPEKYKEISTAKIVHSGETNMQRINLWGAQQQPSSDNGVELNTIKQFRVEQGSECQQSSQTIVPMHHVLHFYAAISNEHFSQNRMLMVVRLKGARADFH